jgi:hypothetical protein
MPKFDDTMENSRVFLTYSLAMTMLGKAAKIIKDRGGDKKAMSFIATGMQLLVEQLRRYADQKDLQDEAEELLKPFLGNAEGSQSVQPAQESNDEIMEKAEQELDRICQILDIKRAED